jgi:hypothetical protein
MKNGTRYHLKCTDLIDWEMVGSFTSESGTSIVPKWRADNNGPGKLILIHLQIE